MKTVKFCLKYLLPGKNVLIGAFNSTPMRARIMRARGAIQKRYYYKAIFLMPCFYGCFVVLVFIAV